MSGLSFVEQALAFSRNASRGHGKIELSPKVTVRSLPEMAVAYTPGVGHVVRHLMKHPEEIGLYTNRDNLIALVTDGSAVLGFGNVGPDAGLPVMEGKAVMFKALAGLDCMPLCLRTSSPRHFCDVVQALQPSFGGINIEDVAAPGCFEVLSTLERDLSVPVIHDDQYGTATVAIAALINALLLTGREPANTRVVVNGVGAAGTATIIMLEAMGIGDIVAVDRRGILSSDDAHEYAHWQDIAARTNASAVKGGLAEAMRGADAFIGLSVGGIVSPEMIRSMAPNAIVFGLANPDPEIMPDVAEEAGAVITASGRFDFPNHCNNVLAFPGLMRGALDVKTKLVSCGMRMAAAREIARLAAIEGLSPRRILPSPLDVKVHAAVAEATGKASQSEGLAGRPREAGEIFSNVMTLTGTL